MWGGSSSETLSQRAQHRAVRGLLTHGIHETADALHSKLPTFGLIYYTANMRMADWPFLLCPLNGPKWGDRLSFVN